MLFGASIRGQSRCPVRVRLPGHRTTLTGWLDWQRTTVRLKCAGLDESDARRQYTPTSPAMTIAGIVRRLADAERHWLVRSFLGEAVSPAPRWWGESDEPLHRSLDAYDAQCERSRQITAAHDLGDIERYAPDGLPLVSLRWILGHLIEETARHRGHLDIFARTHRRSPWLLSTNSVVNHPRSHLTCWSSYDKASGPIALGDRAH
jgi:uncharacterized damage-inducible protein DinB